ncbi:hypothetical protein G647_00704 [Cladophialophora carrionii CBS 160.54]|uniref:Xylanolytic transcriptional activator regulatory domain-containing protein n=1 Tax=Cladophialophora carrionii CBS 160.54 TaxID=1279043 RepID=V9DN02_9EURO|nr:uncharacterized protein G647_00704 [Cladophialophora carrionii CBS 160.54]ETI28255.1 hypothetical protein G647_00704 [Cladophialophora carrionii CBS 160.54]
MLPSSHSLADGHHLSQIEGFASFSHTWEDFASEPFDGDIFESLELAEDESPTSQNPIEHVQTRSDGRPVSNSPQHSRLQSLHPFPGKPLSLDTSSLRRAQVPPDTGHLNRHVMLNLMNRRDHLEVSHIRLERARPANEAHAPDEVVPVLMVREHAPFLPNGAASTSQPATPWQDVEELLSEKQRHELVQLFFHFVQPAFPVLSGAAGAKADSDSHSHDECDLSTASLSLSACIYATALPFSIHNDYLNATLTDANGKREQLYSMAVAAVLAEANAPTIETLQACLLLLQKGPTVQHQGLTPTYSAFASMTVTIAKSLGLQHDCTNWSIPLAEKQLRQRLWWATFIMDVWVSIDTPGGRSICPDDYDVPLPGDGDVARIDHRPDMPEYTHFNCLVDTSHLLSQICRTYYTVRAAKETASDLFKSLEFAKPLRSALNECKQKLKVIMPLDGSGEPGASGSVHLAACVTSIILFRALLRPTQAGISTAPLLGDSHMSAAAAVVTGSINCAREAVELLEAMVSMVGPWSEFWHSWSQGNFAIVSTFLVQLMVMLMSSSEESTKAEVADLISRWKKAIRIGAGSGGWGSSLMSMALSRLDSLLSHAAG